jgi:hypothetical protein
MFDAFLSYARADDEMFVAALYDRLNAAGFRVWFDRMNMPSRGETFLREIQHAIDDSDRLVAVVGPAAVRSDYVRAEWDYAQLFSKAVVPILRAGNGLGDIPAEVRGAGYELVPAELRHFHCPDFRPDRDQSAAFDELERILRQPVTAAGDPHQVPQVPPHFLPRRELLREVAETLLIDAFRPVVIVDAARQTTVVHGLPGAGKSVLASALARAVNVRRSFRDGVVWLSITQTPDLIRQWRRLGDALGDDLSHYSDVHRAEDHLSDLLRDRECLIVLDDIWQAQHVTPVWNALGPRCRLLLTARDKAIGRTFGAAACQADVLAPREALLLLAQWAETSPLPDEAQRVLEECGRLPLALAICGAMVKAKVPWHSIMDALAAADLSFLEHELPNYPYPHVMRALQASIDHLGRLDAAIPQRYYELAAFIPKRRVPERAALTLWSHAGLSERHALKLLATFDSASLLTLTTGDPRFIGLHDLQWDYVRGHSADTKALHQRLVAAYGSPASWPSLQDDGYFFDNIARHVAAAELREEARSLVSRRWMQAQLGRTQNHRAFASDLDAIIDYLARERPVDNAALLRASLVRATLSALSTRVPSTALIALAICGEVGKALGFAELVVDPALRLEAFTGIAAVVHAQGDAPFARRLQSMAVAVALRVENEEDPDAPLTSAVHTWADMFGHEGLDALVAIATEDGDRNRLRRIAASLIVDDESHQPTQAESDTVSPADDAHVWDTAAVQVEHGAIQEAFSSLAAQKYCWSLPPEWAPFLKAILTLNSVLPSLALWNSIADGELRSAVLGDLVRDLAKVGRIEEAQGVARAIAESRRRDEALASVAAAVDKAGQHDVAERIVDGMSTLKAAGLAMVASWRAEAGAVDDARALARRAAAEAASLDAEDRARLIDAVLATVFSRTGDRADAEVHIERGKGFLETSTDESAVESVVAEIAPALARLGRQAEAIALTKNAELSTWSRIRVIRPLAEALVDIGDCKAATGLATSLAWFERKEFLADLMPKIVACRQYDIAVDSLRLMEHTWERKELLEPLTKALLDSGAYREALAALDLVDDHDRPGAAETIAIALVEAGQTALALEAANLAHSAGVQTTVVAHMARRWAARGENVNLPALATASIPDHMKAEIIKAAALGWRDAGVLDRAFEGAMFAPQSERSEVLTELAIAAINAGDLVWPRNLLASIEPGRDRSKAETALVEAYVKGGRLDDAFAVGRAMSVEPYLTDDRTAALFKVLSRALALDRLDVAAVVADSFSTRAARAYALADLARTRAIKGELVTARAHLDEVLTLSLVVPPEDHRDRALSTLGRLLATQRRLDEALAIADVLHGTPRAEVLAAVATVQAATDFHGARERVKGLEALEEFGVRWIEPDALLALARVCLAQHHTAEADELARAACAKSLAAFAQQDALLQSLGTTICEQLAAAYTVFVQVRAPQRIDAILQPHEELLKYRLDDITAAMAGEAARSFSAQEALRLAARIGEPRKAIDALIGVADCLADRNDVSGACEAIRQARAATEMMSEDFNRIEAVGRVAVLLVRVGDLESWTNDLEVATAGSTYLVASRAVSAVALALAETGSHAGAGRWLDRMPRDPPHDAQGAVALALINVGATSDGVAIADQLLRAAPEIETAYEIKKKTLVYAARVFIAAGDPLRAMQCLAACDIDSDPVKDTLRKLVAVWQRERRAMDDSERSAAYWYDVCRSSSTERCLQDAVLGAVCAALAEVQNAGAAMPLFGRSVADARSESRATLFELVRRAAPLFAMLDDGRALVSLSQEIRGVETWWQTNAS